LSRKEKKNLAESAKGSWFGQTPSTILASAEDPERSNILGTRSLQIYGWPFFSKFMVGHSFQNYDRVYAGFSAAYTCLHTLRMGFKLI